MEIRKSDWEGFEKLEFTVSGRESFVVCPKNPLPGNPWVWRAEFFGAFDYPDRALLEKGWHLAYHRVSDMYGCPQAVEWMHEFQKIAEKECGLAPKAALFGFSRGGLYATNYATKYPEKVSVLYLDAPVLDIRSWPGGKGKSPYTPKCWEECKEWYGLTEETAATFAENPLDHVQTLVENQIPVILVVGGADEVVPYDENGEIFDAKYRALGGCIQTIIKPTCGHHPHSLEDPSEIVAFVEKFGK